MTPPFRADHVGSLLRPPEVKEARAKVERGELPMAALTEIEDRAIRAVVAKQEAIGLQAITDGEIRRGWWNHDYLGRIGGVEVLSDEASYKFAGSTEARLTPHVRAKVHRARPMMVEHLKFLSAATTKTAKFTMPSPSILYHRGGRRGVPKEIYPDLAEFWADVGKVYQAELRDLAANGCRYVQIDDTGVAFLCDEKFRDSVRARGDDPDALPGIYADAVNAAIADRPAGMTVAMHTCRGNWKSTWLASGGYEPVAEAVFTRPNVDAFFLEYDSDRAGDFAPLRFMPRTKKVVLGLVSTKSGALETKDELKRRIDAAAKYVPLENLCLSPQCGFASSHHGNNLTEDEQWRKLELVVAVARDVWGSA